MSIIKKGTDFGPTEQVTSTKLDNLVDNASFTDTNANAVAYTGSTGTCLNGGGLEVTSAGQLQIKDSDISTAKLADDAVTPAKTSFIDETTGTLTLLGNDPKVTFDQNDQGEPSSFISGNSVTNDINAQVKKAGGDIILDTVDNFLVRTCSTATSDQDPSSNPVVERFKASHDAAKDENGNSVAGCAVAGGLSVTGDVYVNDHVVADHLKLIGDNPNIFFDQDDQGTPNSFINGDSSVNAIETQVQKAEGDVIMGATDNITMKTCADPTADFDSSSNPYVFRLRAAHDAGKNAAGTDSAGVQVTGDLEVTGGMHLTNAAKIPTIQDNVTIQGSDPKITFSKTGVGTAPIIKAVDTDGDLEILATQSGSNVVLDANDKVFLQYNNNTAFTVGSGEGREADNTFVAGAKVTGALQVTGEANIGTTKLGASSILASSPSNGDDSTKIATTAFVQNASNRAFKEITGVGEAPIAAQDTFVDMPSCNIDITANRANRRFLLSGMLGLGCQFAGSKFLFKWQYRKNGAGTWTDFTLPTSFGNRIPAHFEYGNRMDNNGSKIGCLSYKVRTPQLTHTSTDTINFKLVVANANDSIRVKINSSSTDANDADNSRVISQLEVEQL